MRQNVPLTNDIVRTDQLWKTRCGDGQTHDLATNRSSSPAGKRTNAAEAAAGGTPDPIYCGLARLAAIACGTAWACIALNDSGEVWCDFGVGRHASIRHVARPRPVCGMDEPSPGTIRSGGRDSGRALQRSARVTGAPGDPFLRRMRTAHRRGDCTASWPSITRPRIPLNAEQRAALRSARRTGGGARPNLRSRIAELRCSPRRCLEAASAAVTAKPCSTAHRSPFIIRTRPAT